MHMVAADSNLSPDDLLALPDSKGLELVNGHIVEREMGARSGWIGGQLYRRLENHNECNRAGWVFPADAGFILAESPTLLRKPDAAFVQLGRLPNEEIPEGYIRLVPDLVAEVVSPNDTAYEVQDKVQEYLSAGVKLLWIVYPQARIAHLYRVDGSFAILHDDDELSGEDIFPGFRCRLGDLFPLRSPATIVS